MSPRVVTACSSCVMLTLKHVPYRAAALRAACALQPRCSVSSSPRPRRSAYRWIFGLLVLGALVAVARGFGQERRFVELLRSAEPAWLLAVVALQLATYPALGLAWQRAIARAGGAPPRMWTLVKIAFAELFTDEAVPSTGIAGMIFVVAALRRRGVERRASATAVVASLVAFYFVQFVTVLAAVASLLARHRFVDFGAVVSVIAVLSAVVIPVGAIAIAAGALPRLPRRIQGLAAVRALRDTIDPAPRDVVFAPGTLLRVGVPRLALVLLDGATLAASLAALGSPIPIDEAITAFVLAQIAGSISFLPGGLGSFEAVAAGLLVESGVTLEAAVAAVLLMRGFSFWLPIIPGLWFARRELRGEVSPA